MGQKLEQKEQKEIEPKKPKKGTLLVDVPSWGYIVYKDSKTGVARPYVNHAGMLAKLDAKYGTGNYEIRTRPIMLFTPTEGGPHEIEHPIYGKIPMGNFAYHYCEIRVKTNFGDQVGMFNGEFISHKGNTSPYFHNNMNALNETRAINRAARKATACGFTSVEELKEVTPEGIAIEAESELPAPPIVEKPPVTEAPAPTPDSFLEAVQKVLKIEKMDEAVKLYACKKAGVPKEKYSELTREQKIAAYKDLENWNKKDREALIDYLSHIEELPETPSLF